MTRLLRETLPHLALGALTASPWLAAPSWLPLLAVPQAVVCGLLREHAQAAEGARYIYYRVMDGPPSYTRGPKVWWPPGWWKSKQRLLDVLEIAAGSLLVAGVGVWL